MIHDSHPDTAAKADIIHTIVDLAGSLGVSDVATSSAAKITFAVDDVPVTCALVERQRPLLWLGCYLGNLRHAEHQSLAWLLREAFPLGIVPNLSLGRDPESGDIFAYRLITANGLDADILADVIRDMIEQVRAIREHIKHADFPNIFKEFSEKPTPDTMKSHV